MIVAIASGVAQTLIAAAAAAHPHECCGLLTGRPGHIKTAVPARNISEKPDSSFEIDPATLLATHRAVRAEGLQVIGHYHSHPNGHAEPSARDAARAAENGQLWLIIAAGALHGWHAVAQDTGRVHGRFVPVELRFA